MAAKTQKADVWLQKARKLDPKAVQKLNFDPVEAKPALREGLKQLGKWRAYLIKNHKGFNLAEFDALLELVDRVIVQQRIVQTAVGSRPLKEVLPAALEWRRKLLPFTESLVAGGRVDGARYAAVLKGYGSVDNVTDVADLVALLTPHVKLVEAAFGKGALTQASLASNEALAAMGVNQAPTVEVEAAADLRDRYATLVVQGHDRLRSALAAATTYRDAVTLVPPLVRGSSPKKADAPSDTPKPPSP